MSQLGYFDAQQITPDFKNMNPNDGTVDIEYSVVEEDLAKLNFKEAMEVADSLVHLDYLLITSQLKIFSTAKHTNQFNGRRTKFSTEITG